MKPLNSETKKILDEHAPCHDTMSNAENYFEFKRARLNLTSFLAEMERLHKRFDVFENAISDFDTLGKELIVSEMKVLKSTPSLQDVQKLNAILDDLNDPVNSSCEKSVDSDDKIRKWSPTLEYHFHIIPNTYLAEKTITESKLVRDKILENLDNQQKEVK